jgi:hypothetical protein
MKQEHCVLPAAVPGASADGLRVALPAVAGQAPEPGVVIAPLP